jgi:hypothetical protein
MGFLQISHSSIANIVDKSSLFSLPSRSWSPNHSVLVPSRRFPKLPWIVYLHFTHISAGIPPEIVQQYKDNLHWLDGAGKYKMVVGSQARILYSDQQGRSAIARAFNEAVSTGAIKASLVQLS